MRRSGRCITPGCGPRSPRCWKVRDVHFDRGPFGELHVRYGKAANRSGPRPAWVPMLDELHLVLRGYLHDVRPVPELADFVPRPSWRAQHRGTARNRLRYLLKVEGRPEDGSSPHALRRAALPITTSAVSIR